MLASVARKTLMALTGLFLCVFLAVHLLGNLQLFLPEGQAQTQFNWYAKVLSGLPMIKVAAWLTYISVLAHTILAIVLGIRNRRSVGTGYQAKSPTDLAPWYSRMMGVLGTVILLFLIVHMSDFWWPFKSGADIGVDADGQRDLFGLVVVEFQKGWKVALYVLGVLAVGFHLAHGVYSGLRSLGVSHPGYARWAKRFGYVFAVVVTVGFAAMPLYFYLSGQL
jgi:succinate dehydrogenase / fumarate reductase cytochrome b subunit